MLVALLALGILVLAFAPQLWVRWVMKRHNGNLDHLPGTGGELAEHLIERFKLDGVRVEATEHGDHFDPNERVVRLSAGNFNGRSVTAVAIAAHEVGHAIQCHRNEQIFELRRRFIPLSVMLSRIGSWLLFAAPIVGTVAGSPRIIVIVAGFAFLLLVAGALAYLLVLPEEWDASFNKALPILSDGYLSDAELTNARQVLKAAALTYFAGALASVLSLSRLLLLLRR